MIKAFAFVAFRAVFPVGFSGLQETQRTQHVCPGKRERVFDGAVHMAFGSKMDDAVHGVLRHQFTHLVEVADVRLGKGVIRLVLNVFQIRQVSGIRQFIYINYMVFRIFVHEQAHHVASDETCTAGNDDIHSFVAFKVSKNW